MPFWQFFTKGWDGRALSVRPSQMHHSIWKILFVLGANEYLERLEGKIRKCLFFYSKITGVNKLSLFMVFVNQNFININGRTLFFHESPLGLLQSLKKHAISISKVIFLDQKLKFYIWYHFNNRMAITSRLQLFKKCIESFLNQFLWKNIKIGQQLLSLTWTILLNNLNFILLRYKMWIENQNSTSTIKMYNEN